MLNRSTNSQNYNRFSYVLNNPLKYTDPSGYVALNPWYEYQAGPKTLFYTWMPDYHTDGTYLDNQGRNWKYHGETINTPGFYGDETGMWISKLNEYNELIYSYNELRQIVQNNANSNSFFSSFSMGAGVFRVEGEVGRGNAESNAAQTASKITTVSGFVINVAQEIAKIPSVGYNIAYNSTFLKNVNYLKPLGYWITGFSVGIDVIQSVNGQQSWSKTGLNTAVTGLAIGVGGWPGLVIQADYQASKLYIKTLMKHPEWSPYPIYGR